MRAADEIEAIVRIGEVEDAVAVQARVHVRTHQLPVVRHALAQAQLDASVLLLALDRHPVAAIGVEEHVGAAAVVEGELLLVAGVGKIVRARVGDSLRRIRDRARRARRARGESARGMVTVGARSSWISSIS